MTDQKKEKVVLARKELVAKEEKKRLRAKLQGSQYQNYKYGWSIWCPKGKWNCSLYAKLNSTHNTNICSFRGTQLHVFNGKNQSINEINGMYDSLHYPWMFPYGDPGYGYLERNIMLLESSLDHRIIISRWYKLDLKNTLFYSRLYEEYLWDQYTK